MFIAVREPLHLSLVETIDLCIYESQLKINLNKMDILFLQFL